MADVSDVTATLAGLISNAVYPNGTGQASVSGKDIIIYPGWANPQRLDDDLLISKAHINIYPRAEETIIEHYNPEWQVLSKQTATMTAIATANTVTLSGTITAGHNLSLLINGTDYSYTCQANDTLTTVATAMASLSGGSSVGSVITYSNPHSLVARVGVKGSVIRELRRQNRVFQIVIWCNAPAQRDVISNAVDKALTIQKNITLADGSSGKLRYKSSPMTDDLQKDTLFRRDFLYSVEYATTETQTATAVTIPQTVIKELVINV